MKIAAICAYPSNLNPGMLSVDLALEQVVATLGPDVELVRYNVEQELRLGQADAPLHYRHLRDPRELEGYDHILFWGDFLHWLGYGTHDFRIREQRRHPEQPQEQVMDRWFRLLLLEGRPDLQQRATVFGSTLYGLDARQLGNARYRAALTSLYRHARHVQMRDVYSANFVTQLAPGRDPAFGCDCALLLDGQQLPGQSGKADAGDYLLVAFGRTPGQLALLTYARQIAAASGRRLLTLPWFDHSGIRGLARKTELICQAAAIVTDIYHLSITGLRERVPTLCIGSGATPVATTLSDKKKELLFAQHLGSGNYVYAEEVFQALSSDAQMRALTERGHRALADREANACIFDALAAQVTLARSRLRHALSGV